MTKNKPKSPATKAPAPATSNKAGKAELPLFMKAPAMLDANRHGDAGIKQGGNYDFAKGTNSIPINVTEFHVAAKHYPIVFTDEETPTPVAIVGLEQDNYFVNDKGEWKNGVYIPSYVRKYPFAFTELPAAKQLALCVDEKADTFIKDVNVKNVAKLYKDGRPTPFTQNALEFCTAYHNHFVITRQFGEALKKARILAPNQSEAILKTGRTIRLGGFNVIDQKALNQLPDKDFLELRAGGWLPLIYFALQALSNWRDLVDLAAVAEKQQAPKRKVAAKR